MSVCEFVYFSSLLFIHKMFNIDYKPAAFCSRKWHVLLLFEKQTKKLKKYIHLHKYIHTCIHINMQLSNNITTALTSC